VIRDLVAGDEREVTLTLRPGRRLAGRVVARGGGSVPFAEVKAVAGSLPTGQAGRRCPGFVFPETASATSDGDGNFVLRGLPEGLFDVVARAEGFSRGRTPSVRPTDEGVIVVLNPTFEARVGVVGEVEPAMVTVRTQTGLEATAVKGEPLRFRLGGLERGTHRIEAVAPGYATSRARHRSTISCT